MVRLLIPGGLALVAILTVVSSLPASAGVGSLDAPVSISPAGRDAEDVQLVTDGTSITAAWTRSDGITKDIQASVSGDSGTTWSTPTTVSVPGRYADSPELLTDGTTVMAVWTGTEGGAFRVQFSSSTDAGLTWTRPTTVSAGQWDADPELVVAGSKIIVAWQNFNSVGPHRIYTTSSSDGGSTWRSPVPISRDGQNAFSPQLLTAGSSTTVVWSRYDGAYYRVQASSSADGGVTWSEPVTLSNPGRHASYPRLVSDGSRIAVVWSANNGTPTGNNWVEAASSSDGGTTWTRPVTLSDTSNQTSYGVAVATAGTRMMAVWTATDFSYRVMGAYSVDGGITWSSPIVLSIGGDDDYQMQLVADGTTMTVVWVRLDDGIYRAQVSSSTDGATWSSPATISSVTGSTTASHDHPPVQGLQLVTDGTTITAAWRRFDGSNDRVQVASYTPTSRIAGPDRFSTAAAVAREFDAASTVYVANGHNYPDALSAAPAAGFHQAPLLLTEQDSLPAVVAAEIQRLQPGRIVVVGGTGVVSSGVEAALEALYPGTQVQRLAGADRYETSRVVSNDAFGDAGAQVAVIATGTNFPDALSASAAAAKVGGPVILVPGSDPDVDSATYDLLDGLGTTKVFIAGGLGVVSAAIEASLVRHFGGSQVTRLAGTNRYDTAVAINNEFFVSSSAVYLAVGTGYADALAGAALAGTDASPLYVVPGECVPAAVIMAIRDLGATRVVLFGGTGVLSAGVASLTPCA
jgi:putative cell wall-binding protein